MRIEVELRNGRKAKVHPVVARHLESRGILKAGAAYETRQMQPAVARDAELDSAGEEWDADLHVRTKAKNADGTWRKKPRIAQAKE